MGIFFRASAVSVLMIGVVSMAFAGTIKNSKHDLSRTNPYGDNGSASTEICVFCHTPHNFNIDLDQQDGNDQDHATRPRAPLWNRQLTDASAYTPYTSSTLNADCDATPSPLSLACLSCHDGANASGNLGAVNLLDSHNLVNSSNIGPSNEPFTNTNPNCNACHGRGDPEDGGFVPGKWWQIGPDLSNDHPVSLSYQVAFEQDDYFNAPPNAMTGWSDVKLFNGRVECPSCHNPHDPTNVPFLRRPVTGSSLCLTCHAK